MEAKDPVEEARKANRLEMDKRIERAGKWLRESYPMTSGNTCRLMTDTEFVSYIRMRREAFEPRLVELNEARRQRIAESKPSR